VECFAKDERTTVSVTERLAPLNLHERIEALDDPRFNVGPSSVPDDGEQPWWRGFVEPG
jgi:hypothetical protein